MRHSTLISRCFACAILILGLAPVPGCGKSAHTRGPGASEPLATFKGNQAKAPPVKTTSPDTEPDKESADFDDASITPAGLILALESHLGSSFSREIPKEYLDVIGKALGKPMIPGSSLRALVLSREDRFVGAFIGVRPPKHVACSEEASERSTAFWLPAPTNLRRDGLRLVAISTQVFDGTMPSLVIPETYPEVPFVELQWRMKCPVPGFGGPAYGTEVEVMEAWALVPEGPRMISRLESGSEDPAGYSSTTTGTLTWLRGEKGAFYLAARVFFKSSTPANSAPEPGDDDADVIIVRCEASTKVHKLDAKGQAIELTRQQVVALRKSDPSLAALPADGRGNSEDACSDLELDL